MPDFPVLDASYIDSNLHVGRQVVRDLGVIEPRVDEVDWWFTLPLRLVISQADGFHVAIGPYALNAADIEVLRNAIGAYDRIQAGEELSE
ncbi:hypothetical protein [Mycobacterium paraffinicum]|uniref:Uncharacterized protein n=1 Tax=Mycobacterium paraffinicum TaxID=53378 RepID=A0ABP8F7Z2_9MYCO|nr:hypothetical protein [Mycobacterium paraffinicum]MCV7313731.1 hypothetical protein [Mycobacterium paraffinicum]